MQSRYLVGSEVCQRKWLRSDLGGTHRAPGPPAGRGCRVRLESSPRDLFDLVAERIQGRGAGVFENEKRKNIQNTEGKTNEKTQKSEIQPIAALWCHRESLPGEVAECHREKRFTDSPRDSTVSAVKFPTEGPSSKPPRSERSCRSTSVTRPPPPHVTPSHHDCPAPPPHGLLRESWSQTPQPRGQRLCTWTL